MRPVFLHNPLTHGIHLQIVRLPPGNRSKAHKHDGHETAIYILGGESGMWYGEKLEQHLVARAGDFLYIPANMPHLPYNLSDTESCVAVIARTDPNEQVSVVLLPELETRPDWLVRNHIARASIADDPHDGIFWRAGIERKCENEPPA